MHRHRLECLDGLEPVREVVAPQSDVRADIDERAAPIGGARIEQRLLLLALVRKTPERWTWKPYKPVPAQMFFTEAELARARFAKGAVMLEPNVKDIGHTNKAWIWERWEELAYRIRKELKLDTLQCLPAGAKALTHVRTLPTPRFRDAAAALHEARAFVGTEGGLMHAAAAVQTPAVILWSEFISPEITGYDTLVNLRHAGKPCGLRTNCPGCKASMEAITVDEVLESLKGILK